MTAMEKNNKTLNVPHLRFPEFSGEWEICNLKRFATKITKKNKGNICSNVLSNSANHGIIPQSDFFDRSIANSDNTDTYYVIEGGDFVYNPRKSTTAPYGPINVYEGTEVGIISPLYLCFKVEWINKKYLYHYFKSNKWHPYMYINGDSGARHDRVSIKDDVFLDMPLFIPSQKEQWKITLLLDAIDKRIETQRKIIEKYESLIRGLYHSCFCNSDSTTTKLSDVVTIVKGKQVNGENLLKNGQYYVMNGGIEPSGYLNEYNTPADTISISEGGNSCGYVQYNKEPFWSGGHCYSLMPKSENVCYRFLYHFLKYKENDIMALRIGSGLPNVQKKDLERFEVHLPSLERQREIAKLLDIISSKRDLERQLQYSWQCQKDYMLGFLFI